MTIEAVTFDHWNTLVSEVGEALRSLRVGRFAHELAEAGHDISDAPIEEALDVAWAAFSDAWAANVQFDASQSVAKTIERLGVTVPADASARLVAMIADTTDRDLPLLPGVEECMHTLKGAGVRLGIICDVGLTPSTALRANLDKEGVLDLFDHWSFSDDVRAYKPSAEIFQHALAGLGVSDPARAAHVGDLRRTDIAGAQAVGMIAVRYTGVFDDPAIDGLPDGDHVLDDHALLAAALGIEA